MESTKVPVEAVQSSGTLLYMFLGLATVLGIFHFWQQNKRFFKLGNALPGPRGIPFFGSALIALTLKNSEEVVKRGLEYAQLYGKVVKFWIGSGLLVFLLDPRDIEVILSSNDHLDKADEYQLFKPWLGDGLLISSGEKWRSHRKMIAPTFHTNVLKSFIDVFNQKSQYVVKKLQLELGKVFDVHEYMGGITVDILLETVMGVKRTHSDDTGVDYATAVMRLCDILHQRHYKLWLRPEFLFNLTSMAKKQLAYLGIIHGLTSKVVKTKKADYKQLQIEGKEPSYYEQIQNFADEQDRSEAESAAKMAEVKQDPHKTSPLLRDDLDVIDENDVGEKKRLAFLDLMVETAAVTGKLSDDEIKEEVDTIMFEGHDTTAAGSSFVLSLLGYHQDIQDKVYQELYNIFGDSDRPVTYLDTLEMKYLERVIFESLRICPPVPIIARKLKQEVKLPSSGHILPIGSTVIIGTYKVHHDPDTYPEPEKFDPDNFLPERTQKRHYYSYIPFSAGPRSCVGRKYAMLKLKVLLATILRNYRITSNIHQKDFRLIADIILKRAGGFNISVEPRKRVSPGVHI